MNINAIGNSKLSGGIAGENNNYKTRSTGAHNGWTASEVRIAGSEDLGGGLKASFAIASGIGSVPDAGQTGFADRDRFLQLDGGFGSVRIGRFVPTAGMGFHGFSGAATTSTAGTLYGIGNASTTAGGATHRGLFAGGIAGSFERNANNVQYTSPNFNGFSVSANYGTSSTDVGATGFDGKTETRISGLGVSYSAGPLRVAAGMNERKGKVEANPGAAITVFGDTLVASANTAQSSTKADLDWIGASYDLGVATVMLTHVKRKDTSTTAAGVTTTNGDIKTNAFGVSVPMGAFTVNASMYRGKNNLTSAGTDDTKLNGHQLSVRYALSKRTVVYAAMGENKVKRSGGNTTGVAGKFTSNNIGLMHSF